jgi:hydroxymethylpyrimidine/phosphomethylpyrimidine kinase
MRASYIATVSVCFPIWGILRKKAETGYVFRMFLKWPPCLEISKSVVYAGFLVNNEKVMSIPVALTIAGSDPSGGAGIQADLKTFHQREVYGTSVITLVTVQNSQRVSALEMLPSEIVAAQLEAVLEDMPPAAAKTGALGSWELVRLIAGKAGNFTFPLVVDPVMISKHGLPLMTEQARAALREFLLPKAFLVTPNLHEAGELAGMAVCDLATMREAAVRIASLGANAVLVKGGHLETDSIDLLYWNGETVEFRSPRIQTIHTHGTGCTFSACITAELAKGQGLVDAVRIAKKYITRAIETNPGLGKGNGPVNHHARI